MINRATTMTREKDDTFVTLRFYNIRTRYIEDSEIIVSVTQTGWVRIPLTDLGQTMIERDIYEFWTEEDVQIHARMSEEGATT